MFDVIDCPIYSGLILHSEYICLDVTLNPINKYNFMPVEMNNKDWVEV